MNTIIAYHGTSALFDKFDQGKARVANDYYGGGVAYFTSNRDIAKQYANAMAKNNKVDTKIIYTVQLKINKMFDVDADYSKKLFDFIRESELEQFARNSGLLKFGVDKYEVLANLKLGNVKLTGDSLFRGLSSGMVNTSSVREKLKKIGFDSLRYNGGLTNFWAGDNAIKHDVYLMYNANNITILNRSMLIKKNPLNHITNNIQFAVEEV